MEHHEHSITGVGVYITVFLTLMVLTGVTVGAAALELGWFNTPVALAIAGTKAAVVVWFFMELRQARPLTKLAALSAVAWLSLLLIFTFGDFGSRHWVANPQNWLK